MNVTDLIIIYLSCGSPFGVYQITRRQPTRSRFDWVSVVSSFLFWPAYATTLLARRIFPNAERAEAERRNRIENIRLDIERIAFSGGSISSLFEFREVFYRFTGLSEAANAPIGKSANEIFEITGHHNKSLASRCLTRRNAERLAFHQSRVQSEFVDLISRLSIDEVKGGQIVGLSLGLADNLGNVGFKTDVLGLYRDEPKTAASIDYPVEAQRRVNVAAKATR